MTLFTSIILISFYQIIFIYGDFPENNVWNDYSSNLSPSNGIPAGLFSIFGSMYPVNTFSYSGLSDMIIDSRTENNQCEVKFNSDIESLLGRKMFVGTLSNTNQILAIKLTFYDANGDPVRDDDDQPIEYTSNRQDFGHILDILHQGFAFSYAKCLFKLEPNSNFDINNMFFHFSQSLPNNVTAKITGPRQVWVDSIAQSYTVSINCPSYSICMWLLDDTIINGTPNTSIMLTFEQKHIGNRRLSYVAYSGNVPQILASLRLSILSTNQTKCLQLPRRPKNAWLYAGNMSTPRVYFTATFLPMNESIMVVGGTADGSHPLSSVEIYNTLTGCFNMISMNYARMHHTAAYFNSSDMVLVMGGLGSSLTPIGSSELISIAEARIYQSMLHARYQHVTVNVIPSFILTVAGQGFNNTSGQVEIYNRSSSSLQQSQMPYPQLNNLEGHSVTILGQTGLVLIFGGYNGTAYSAASMLDAAQNLVLVESEEEAPSPRAHHQATYISSLNAVLITGGDNGTHIFSSCYLYYFNNQTFNSIVPMQQARSFHSAVLLSNNSVLIIGGATEMDINNQPKTPTRSVERYDISLNTSTIINSLNVASYSHEAVSVADEEIFIFGGFDAFNRVLSRIENIMY